MYRTLGECSLWRWSWWPPGWCPASSALLVTRQENSRDVQSIIHPTWIYNQSFSPTTKIGIYNQSFNPTTKIGIYNQSFNTTSQKQDFQSIIYDHNSKTGFSINHSTLQTKGVFQSIIQHHKQNQNFQSLIQLNNQKWPCKRLIKSENKIKCRVGRYTNEFLE